MEKEVTVRLQMVQCPRCSRYMSNYYEATLQVRAMNRPLTEEEKEELDRFVRKEVEKRLKKDRMAFISKFIPKKEGLDYQIGSMGGARNIASSIKAKYGGKIKETAKLVGVDKNSGKNLYRITIVVRIPEYKVGDIVEYRDKVYKVVSIKEDKLYLEDITERGEKIPVPWSTAEKETRLLKKWEECPTATVISVSPETVIAMDDSSYEVYEYNNVFKDIEEGDVLRIYKKDDVSYVVGVDKKEKRED